MLPYEKEIGQVLEEYNVKVEQGLSTSQLEEQIVKYGKNVLKEKKKSSMWIRFLEQFKDVMILILLVAAAVSFVIALNGHDRKEFIEPILILLIVILNAVIGVVQENKAQNALEALKNLSAPHARVLRNGGEELVEASELVPGDIILFEAGDFVPADARLIESASLKSDESALTGESLPVEKDAKIKMTKEVPLGDRKNMIYSGCSITYGRGKAIVVNTGMNSEMGKIAGLLNEEESLATPLQIKLSRLGKYLGIMALIICAIIFIIGLLSGMSVLELFMTSVSLAVSAIPEGLPAIVTVVLSLGVERMVKRNAIIKRLPAVETLGSASIICSDKTGTLTQNKMTVKMAYHNGSVVPEEITQDNSEEITQLLKYATLCCDGSIIINGTEIGQIGDPTETSILVAAYLNGIIKEELAKEYERVAEIPFDSERKLMSVIVRDGEEYLVIVKGGFDVITQCCNEVDFSQCENIVESFSKEALRVLAVAYKRLQIFPQEITSEELECNLNFMGIVGMIDPPREEAKQAVALCKEAGIRPIMITGDHVMTASAIARQLGILNEKEEAITGSELEHMTEEELQHRVRNISVYARVSPEDKIRIVKAWKSQGEVVAMTGDGVNDAPALKAADIGCAMGITGTDVAKGAADMTLTDDNFATIVEAVREGRGIYDNIRKTVAFLLGTNIGEVITVFFAMLFFKTSPLLSMHLLWINLVTDSFPAIALGMEPVDKNIMRKHPRRRDESIFAEGLGTKIALQGIMFGVLSIFAFYYGCRFQVSDQTIDSGRTMAFAVLGLSQIVHSFNMRSDRSLFEIGVFSNKTLNMACGISFILMCFILFVPPVTYAFGLVSLSTFQYIVIILLSSIPLIVLEGSKKMTEED